ncbi:site-specific DNA-methyltransferase [Indiicoccus explosivorum]|uniref:site-specific DNA-methyltransferase n=1 Tax=Indiicoccus explosivorum TaxID=1917864 RepID=UPI000B431972|nr:site-specific DNA-methyltransferase [Indiicoccus explosivorum]
MQKLDGKTANIAQENIEKLKQLFPEVFTENKIDFEKLQLTLGEHIETEKERYQFTWNGKTEAMQLAQKQSTGTLIPVREESVNWDSTQNIYVEGDNLEVLRLLQLSYFNKIKMIYIDPPYNTGNDFIYKDDFQDNIENYKETIGESFKSNAETNGRYHTDWLNMMYPRLKVAKSLLSKDGMIFISISDHEVHNLRKICDEIFEEKNYVGTIVWEKKKKPSFLDRNMGSVTEYIIIYSKNNAITKPLSIDLTEAGKKYPLNNAGNSEKVLTFPVNSVSFTAIEGSVEAQDMSEGKIKTTLLDNIVIENGTNKESFRLKGEWRYSQEKLDEIINNGEEIVISKIPFRPNHIKKGGEIKKIKNLFTLSGGFPTYEDADKEITNLFGTKMFDYTKPELLIRKLLQSMLYDDPEAIVLDFFSGSGTTAHALMNLNSSLGGKRKFILVQIPESIHETEEAFKAGFKNICEIGKNRIRRAGSNIIETNQDNQNIEEVDIGFRVFKLDKTNLKIWDEEAGEIEENLFSLETAVKDGRSQEDVLYEVLLKYGIELTVPVEEKQIRGRTVFSVGFGYLVVCLEIGLSLEDIEYIAKSYKKCERMVFLDNGFASDEVKINAEQVLKRNGVTDIRVI